MHFKILCAKNWLSHSSPKVSKLFEHKETVKALHHWIYVQKKYCLSPLSSAFSPPWPQHDIRTEQFLHYWPIVRGIHWSPADSLHKGPVMQSFVCFVSLNELLHNQFSCQRFKMEWCSCYVIIMKQLQKRPSWDIPSLSSTHWPLGYVAVTWIRPTLNVDKPSATLDP